MTKNQAIAFLSKPNALGLLLLIGIGIAVCGFVWEITKD